MEWNNSATRIVKYIVGPTRFLRNLADFVVANAPGTVVSTIAEEDCLHEYAGHSAARGSGGFSSGGGAARAAAVVRDVGGAGGRRALRLRNQRPQRRHPHHAQRERRAHHRDQRDVRAAVLL